MTLSAIKVVVDFGPMAWPIVTAYLDGVFLIADSINAMEMGGHKLSTTKLFVIVILDGLVACAKKNAK